MTVTDLIDVDKIEQEFVFFLRNSDIFSTTTRGVTTDTATGSLSSETEILIDASNVRNIRSITVGGTAKNYGEDYTVNQEYDDAGTTKCQITFGSAQTGDYEVSYDYGSDKIFTDFPRVDLSINSYPRMNIEITNYKTQPLGLGASSTLNDFLITIYIYVNGKDDLNTYMNTLREKLLEAQKDFYYIPFVHIQSTGPTINEPSRADKILTKTIELRGLFQVEDIS
jgi:hypothetical protein